MMSNKPYEIYVVVDPNFGERLAFLPVGVAVWIVDTPANKPVAQRLWKERPQDTHLTGITIYDYSENASPEENFLKELDTIDLHHGLHSANPAIAKIEVIGTPLTNKIRFELANYGFRDFSSIEDGFTATRPMRTTQT